jgi:hypothetical protein
MLDFTAVMAKAQKEGWALVALDCAVDTTTLPVKPWLMCSRRSRSSSVVSSVSGLVKR